MSSDADRVRRSMGIAHLIYHNSTGNGQDTASVRRGASHEARFRREECSRSFTGWSEFRWYGAEVSFPPLFTFSFAFKPVSKDSVKAMTKVFYY